jgi:hypothetical protein
MKIKFLIPLFLFAVIFLSSCLKDSPNYIQVANSAAIIEFGLSPANGVALGVTYPHDTSSLPITDTAVALVIASPQTLTKDITVTVAVDSSQVAAYDSANSANYTMMPSNLYTLTSTSITIKAGYRVGRIPVTINVPDFPATHNYALPLVIKDGGGLIISANSGTFLWLF